jgi:predicted permease
MIALEIANIILPVFIIITVGFLIGKYSNIDTKSASDLCLFVFSPALFFNSIINSTLATWELVKIIVFALSIFAIFALLVKLLANILKMDDHTSNALMLASGFPNSGNYSLPIILFAFGEPGLAVGIIFMAIQSFLINSAGVFYASQAHQGFKDAILNIFRIPGFLALSLGFAMRLLEIQMPAVLDRPIGLLGSAAIPTILILLGINLGRVAVEKALKFVSLATGLKLLVYPLIGFLLVGLFFPVSSLEAKVLFLCVAAPTAATTTLLAAKFNTKPELVSSVMFVTTTLSLITVSMVLVYVMQ